MKRNHIDGFLDLKTRTHGDYKFTSGTAQQLKTVLRNSSDWETNLTPLEQESIEMICTKLARWLHAPDRRDESLRDTKLDIIGYVRLTISSGIDLTADNTK